jgi:ankyrin repeat protein
MELTLTGASTLSDNVASPLHTAATKSNDQATTQDHGRGSHSHTHSHGHSHGHGHSHTHNGEGCCDSHAPPPRKINASALLPSREQVQRFKNDKLYRMNVLANVIRGGPYELFLSLITVLVSTDDIDSPVELEGIEEYEAKVKQADQVALAQKLEGYGNDGHTLCHWCCKRGDEPRYLAFLIEKSYIPHGSQLLIDLHMPSKDKVGMYPLHWAVTEGAIPLVSMLLEHLQERPSPPLRRSSSSSLMQEDENRSNTVDSSNGIDARDASNCTPLLIAAQYGHPDLAAFLICRGADPKAVDSSRDTALHWAAYKGSVEVCGMLLHMLGVEGHLDSQDAYGQSPVHLASLRGNVDTLRYLLEEAEGVGRNAVPTGDVGISTGRVGSKTSTPSSTRSKYPASLLRMEDKDGKTPLDLAIKKKKVGTEMLLHEYEERYIHPKRSFFSQVVGTCKDLVSIRTWKAWMGMSGGELPHNQNPTFPFYWMTAHILIAGIFYATQFIGIGAKGQLRSDAMLLADKVAIHVFFIVTYIATWTCLYYVYKTNPGVLDAQGGSDSSSSATCKVFCCGGGYAKDKISREMTSVTNQYRRKYDEVIESFGKSVPSSEERVPLCHTCRIVKPMRSKHCRVARRCVLNFDHHCPFVGTTIGLYNYIHFYLFLVFFVLMGIGMITSWILFIHRSNTFPRTIFFFGGYLALYLFPVMMMAIYHTQLLCKNITTNEQINARKYRYFWDNNRQFHNPFDQGIITNVLQKLSPSRNAYEFNQHGRVSEVEMTSQHNDEETQAMLDHIA